MNARILPVVLTLTLLSLTTGCSGMRNFFFGRGASCGLCNRLSTAGQALNPFAPAPTAPAIAPPQAPCNTCPAPYASGYAAAPTYAPAPQVDCGCAPGYIGSGVYGSACPSDVCGSGEVVGGYGAVYGDVGSGVILGDNFQSRNYAAQRVDERGDVIISEDPLPPGAIVP
ncbi:MAG: hypothetical protein AAGA03_00780 [Planctomycetota bacterium]